MSHSAGLILWALSLGGGGELEITDVRSTFGYLGATKPKMGTLPGESVFFAFNVKNLTLDKDAKAHFTLFVEVLDPKNEVVYSQGPRKLHMQTYFGGNTVPCHAHMMVPLDAVAGEYTLKVTVADSKNGKKASFTGKGKVLAPDFGIIRVGTFGEGRAPRAPVGTVGEVFHVHFSLINFGRDKKGMVDAEVSLTILNEKGEAIKAPMQKHHIHEAVPAGETVLPLQFGLTLDRPGRYQMEVSAKDNGSGKTSQVRIPIRVLDAE